MPHPADIVLDANYAGPHAFDAEYFAPGVQPSEGAGLACRVMRGGQQAGLDMGGLASRPIIDTETVRVRLSEIAVPKPQAHFRITGTGDIYELRGEPEIFDRARREWTCPAIRVPPRTG
ncbi:MAG: hypothetical protein Q8S09_07325 [Hyphomonas sp.]|nr:hypothetical protein [Hyphomonas sp.]